MIPYHEARDMMNILGDEEKRRHCAIPEHVLMNCVRLAKFKPHLLRAAREITTHTESDPNDLELFRSPADLSFLFEWITETPGMNHDTVRCALARVVGTRYKQDSTHGYHIVHVHTPDDIQWERATRACHAAENPFLLVGPCDGDGGVDVYVMPTRLRMHLVPMDTVPLMDYVLMWAGVSRADTDCFRTDWMRARRLSRWDEEGPHGNCMCPYRHVFVMRLVGRCVRLARWTARERGNVTDLPIHVAQALHWAEACESDRGLDMIRAASVRVNVDPDNLVHTPLTDDVPDMWYTPSVGLIPDGYGWTEQSLREAKRRSPKFPDRLHAPYHTLHYITAQAGGHLLAMTIARQPATRPWNDVTDETDSDTDSEPRPRPTCTVIFVPDPLIPQWEDMARETFLWAHNGTSDEPQPELLVAREAWSNDPDWQMRLMWPAGFVGHAVVLMPRHNSTRHLTWLRRNCVAVRVMVDDESRCSYVSPKHPEHVYVVSPRVTYTVTQYLLGQVFSDQPLSFFKDYVSNAPTYAMYTPSPDEHLLRETYRMAVDTGSTNSVTWASRLYRSIGPWGAAVPARLLRQASDPATHPRMSADPSPEVMSHFQLPPQPIHRETEQLCHICLEPVGAADCTLIGTRPVRTESCRHHFCQTCILQWMSIAMTCPSCRGELGVLHFTTANEHKAGVEDAPTEAHRISSLDIVDTSSSGQNWKWVVRGEPPPAHASFPSSGCFLPVMMCLQEWSTRATTDDSMRLLIVAPNLGPLVRICNLLPIRWRSAGFGHPEPHRDLRAMDAYRRGRVQVLLVGPDVNRLDFDLSVTTDMWILPHGTLIDQPHVTHTFVRACTSPCRHGQDVAQLNVTRFVSDRSIEHRFGDQARHAAWKATKWRPALGPKSFAVQERAVARVIIMGDANRILA